MSTSANRGATWTNSDGLVVGFGTNKPVFEGSDLCNDDLGVKTVAVVFDWKNLNAANAINCPVPAGAKILTVRVDVDETFTSTGTNTFEVGDGSDANGFISTTVGTVANMTKGAKLYSDGVYVFATTDTTAPEQKLYTSADTIDLVSAQTDWLGGKATLVVSYI